MIEVDRETLKWVLYDISRRENSLSAEECEQHIDVIVRLSQPTFSERLGYGHPSTRVYDQRSEHADNG